MLDRDWDIGVADSKSAAGCLILDHYPLEIFGGNHRDGEHQVGDLLHFAQTAR